VPTTASGSNGTRQRTTSASSGLPAVSSLSLKGGDAVWHRYRCALKNNRAAGSTTTTTAAKSFQGSGDTSRSPIASVASVHVDRSCYR